jgi:Acetyltransferase (GNAT) domain
MSTTYSFQVISPGVYRAWFAQHEAALQHRSPFHHPAWLDVVGRGSRGKVALVGAYHGGDLVAVVPGFLARRGPFLLFGSPLRGTMTSYLGPIGLRLEESPFGAVELIRSTRDFVRRQWGVNYTEFILPERPPDASSVGPQWRQAQPASYRLDLRAGEEALWAGLKQTCRTQIRKAERLGIKVVPLASARAYHQMHRDTFARWGMPPPHPESFFRIILDELVPRGLVWAWGAEHETRMVAAALFLRDADEVHYISGASNSADRSLPTSHLLQWHAITSAAQANHRVYDLTGRGVPSIDRFKEQFGPQPVEYWSTRWAQRHVRLAERVFTAVQSCARSLPGALPRVTR